MLYHTAILLRDFRKQAIRLCAKLQQVSKPPCWIIAIKIKLQSLKCVIQLQGREPLCALWIQLEHFLNHLSCVDFYKELKPITALTHGGGFTPDVFKRPVCPDRCERTQQQQHKEAKIAERESRFSLLPYGRMQPQDFNNRYQELNC